MLTSTTLQQKLTHVMWLSRVSPADFPWFLKSLGDKLLPTEFSDILLQAGPYSMCGYARLRGIYEGVRRAVDAGVPGDVVECGSARGGSAATAALTLLARGAEKDRRVWLFDTFAGLPAPTAADPDYDKAVKFIGKCRGDLAEVEDLFRRLGVHDRAVFVKGLFEDTVPETKVGPIAMLHLDGDWYRSVKVCLDHLYDRVSPGGVIQIDDYGHWQGARKAVDEFLAQRGISVPLRYLDYTGRQWIKR